MNGKSSNNPSTNLPILSQIAEEDFASASTSITSFHLHNRRRSQPLLAVPPARTLSDQDLFTRVNNNSNEDPLSSSSDKRFSYSHFNFEQANKQQQQQQQLIKGNSLVSTSSDSVDLPVHQNDSNTRRRGRISPLADTAPESSPNFLSKSTKNKDQLRKQTQDIAAKAAQRRANLHHKELMQDLGSTEFSEQNPFNDNTASTFGLEITSVKPKKTVTINDRRNEFRRTNSDSPELFKNGLLIKICLVRCVDLSFDFYLDPLNQSTNNTRQTKTQPKKRSICKFKSQ
mgnify:FL=1